MTFGHLFFAGSGKNSRHSEMVVALCPNVKMCRSTGLGKAFWETPVATVSTIYVYEWVLMGV